MRPLPIRPRIFCRSLAAAEIAGVVRLDAQISADGTSRIFYSARSADAVFTLPGAAARMRIAGAVGLRFAPGVPAVIALAERITDAPRPARAEPEILAGGNVLMGCRSVETPAQVAHWLRYHHIHHGATGAVILNRAKGASAGLAEALEAMLDVPVTVILCDSPLPLGRPDMAPECHPLMAPDAPGKDRMPIPPADPWLSPLGEGAAFEILKHRFLTEARAVLMLDASDILAMPDAAADPAPNALDCCVAAPTGVVALVGRRIYPWRVRPGVDATFGDHICRPFDARRGIARWGAAPRAAGIDKIWRLLRIEGALPDAGEPLAFWRAMALRVPGRRVSELVPKTSLIADPGLITMAENCFAARPVRPPRSTTRAREGSTCIVSTMKNEGPFILEWIAHHRAIGVKDFLIYSNDCTDGTDRLLDGLARRGIVTHRDNPFRSLGLPPQHAALQAAEHEDILRNAGWVICMDVDEFINIRVGDGRLPGLYAAMEREMPGANMIALTWRLFGNGDRARYEPGFVTRQFTDCAPERVRKPHQAWGFKTLFRNIDIYRKLGVHRPKGLKPDLWDQVRWLNGSGHPMPHGMFRNGWRSTAESYGYDWVALNHYAVRDAESFLVKRDRGRVNHVERDQGLNYWFRMNHNATRDLSILRMAPAMQREYDALLQDDGIRAAHLACLAAHRARIDELRSRPDYAALHDTLTSDRMQDLSRMLDRFGASVFNAGPGVIPPDLHLRDLPPNFHFTVDHDDDAVH